MWYILNRKVLLGLITCLILTFFSWHYYCELDEILIYENQQYSIADPLTRENEYSLILDSNLNIINEPGEKNQEKVNLHALSAALIDGDSGRVLYEKYGYSIKAMASTTKIMTCIIALENSKPDEIVTVSKYASTMPDVQLGIREGEQYYMLDMLYALMLESHNDVAVAIAEHIGGTVEGFAAMMNEKARELGCENTNFVTPNGLDAQGHHTTAVEMAKIGSYAIKNPDFITITNAANWSFKELTKNRSFMVSNKDKFLYMYDGAIGVKTGFTNKAGYCFVGAVRRNDATYVSSVLGSGWPPNKNLKWRDTSNLMDYGVKNFSKKDIFYPHTFGPIYVEDGKERVVGLDYWAEIPVLISDNDYIKICYYTPKQLEAPVDKNTIIGKAIYYVNDEIIKEVPILTTETVEKIDLDFCIDKVISLWLNEIN